MLLCPSQLLQLKGTEIRFDWFTYEARRKKKTLICVPLITTVGISRRSIILINDKRELEHFPFQQNSFFTFHSSISLCIQLVSPLWCSSIHFSNTQKTHSNWSCNVERILLEWTYGEINMQFTLSKRCYKTCSMRRMHYLLWYENALSVEQISCRYRLMCIKNRAPYEHNWIHEPTENKI